METEFEKMRRAFQECTSELEDMSDINKELVEERDAIQAKNLELENRAEHLIAINKQLVQDKENADAQRDGIKEELKKFVDMEEAYQEELDNLSNNFSS